MDAQLTRRAFAIFEEVCDLPPEARDAALVRACGPDPALREQVDRLLAEDLRGRTEEPGSAWAELRAAIPSLAGEPPSAPMDDVPPPLLGSYRIIRKIGEGGMGVVYEAEQADPQRRVALKVIRGGLLTPGGIRRFRRESDALGRLNHPGIARIYEARAVGGGDRAQPYFAMELVLGESIDRFVRTHGLDARAIVRLLIEVCETIDYAHQRGVIHRDLKPTNILVDADGRTRLIDFGVAVARPGPGEQPPTAATLVPFAGTLAYTSPEQASGESDGVDARSDIYALGMVLFELLAGRPAFDLARCGLLEALRTIRDEDPPRLGALVPELRGDLDAIVAKATEKDRARRYQSAHEFAADLERYLTDLPITARPPGGWYLLRKYARRHRRGVISGALVFAVLIVGTVFTTVAWQTALTEKRLRTDQYVAAREAFTDIVRRITKGEESAVQVAYRLELLRAMVTHIEELGGTDPDNNDLATLRAATLVRLGSAQREMGDFDGAQVSQETAFEIRRRLALGSPVDVERQRDLAESEVKLGDLAKERGALLVARTWFLDALAIHERLAAAVPANLAVLDDLSWSLERVGAIWERLGDLQVADEYYERREVVAERLARERPEDAEAVHGLFCSAAYRAGVCDLLGEVPQAADYRRRALVHAERMLALKPDNPRFIHACDAARAQVAIRDGVAESRPELPPDTTDALRHAERLVRDDPQNPYYAVLLSSVLHTVADADVARGAPDVARAGLARANDLLTRAMVAAPANLELARSALGIRLRLATVEQQVGLTAVAESRMAEGLALAQRLAESSTDPQAIVEMATLMLDAKYTAHPDPRSAIRYLESALAHHEHPGFQMLTMLRRLHREVGDAAGAADDCRRLLAVIPLRDTPLRRELAAAAR